MLICFQLVRLARKTLCDLEGNLNSSAWLQVTPELCSSFYFCISFRSSPAPPTTPAPQCLSSSNTYRICSMLRRCWCMRSPPQFCHIRTLPSLLADETESQGAQETFSNSLLERERPISNLSWPDPNTERQSLCSGPAIWLLAPLTFNTKGTLPRIQESFPDLALMSLLSFRYSDSL